MWWDHHTTLSSSTLFVIRRNIIFIIKGWTFYNRISRNITFKMRKYLYLFSAIQQKSSEQTFITFHSMQPFFLWCTNYFLFSFYISSSWIVSTSVTTWIVQGLNVEWTRREASLLSTAGNGSEANRDNCSLAQPIRTMAFILFSPFSHISVICYCILDKEESAVHSHFACTFCSHTTHYMVYWIVI